MDGAIWEMNLWSLMRAGGPIMVPIVLCSFFALAIFIEKMMYFASIRDNVSALKKMVFDLLKANKIKEAFGMCERSPSPVAKVLKAGIEKFGDNRDAIKENMEDASLFAIPRLESRLTALATIAHISPLLGLLGTVTGMTTSFHTIQVRANSLNPVTPGDLAGGIGEALLTTVAGLMVAIPTFVIYNYCVHRVNQFIVDMERGATELVNLMCHLTESKRG